MNTDTIEVQVVGLLVGDRLMGSGLIVVGAPVRGLRTPPGKHEVTVVGRSGKKRVVTWNSATRMRVIPAPPCFEPDDEAIDNLSTN